MNEIISIDFAPKAQALLAIHALIPEAIDFAAEHVGLDGVKNFFNGYKEAPEVKLLAA